MPIQGDAGHMVEKEGLQALFAGVWGGGGKEAFLLPLPRFSAFG